MKIWIRSEISTAPFLIRAEGQESAALKGDLNENRVQIILRSSNDVHCW